MHKYLASFRCAPSYFLGRLAEYPRCHRGVNRIQAPISVQTSGTRNIDCSFFAVSSADLTLPYSHKSLVKLYCCDNRAGLSVGHHTRTSNHHGTEPFAGSATFVRPRTSVVSTSHHCRLSLCQVIFKSLSPKAVRTMTRVSDRLLHSLTECTGIVVKRRASWSGFAWPSYRVTDRPREHFANALAAGLLFSLTAA
jgi:hypothetical protein